MRTANKCPLLFMLFVCSSAPHVSATQELYPNAAPVNGVQLVLSVAPPEPNSKLPRFRVEFRNVTEHDLILNLGMMLANGRRQFPNALILNITDQQGVHRQFSLIGPPGIGGRVDPFWVPLPVGAMFSIPIDLTKYWAAASKEWDYKLKLGTFWIQAEFKGRSVSERQANLDTKYVGLFPYWEGVVDSNELRFEISGR